MRSESRIIQGGNHILDQRLAVPFSSPPEKKLRMISFRSFQEEWNRNGGPESFLSGLPGQGVITEKLLPEGRGRFKGEGLEYMLTEPVDRIDGSPCRNPVLL